MRKFVRPIAALGAAGLLAAGCSNGGNESEDVAAATGPIDVWLSTNEQEIAWGEAVVEAWNSENPDAQVTVQELPAGSSSEEVISAAITAGTSPCLVFNIASGAVPGWVTQGGLVDLSQFDDGSSYITGRGGSEVETYMNDGGYYQLPWKSNPVMVMYNKAIFADAGLDPEDPGMETYADFVAGAERIVNSGAAESAVWPSPTSQFYRPWFDFYPLYLAETGGTPFIEDGAATFNDDNGRAVVEFWQQMYSEGLAPQEESPDDAMSAGTTAMQLAGPWAINSYAETVDVGFMPVPTSSGADDVYTFADSKNVSMFTSCENPGTAWEFLKFATNEDNDGLLLELTGQMPLRTDLEATYPEYFEANPAYEAYADQASRVVDVPVIPNSVEVWQTFRDEFSEGVIFGSEPADVLLDEAAEEINRLVQE